ncbi:protoporphyrinogen oxidase 2 isoform X4 [Cucumis melo]|uniref:Protoporphyrinogen oxidase n=1 Tax=Cucumis melo TaxID=3656 RepID=A0ABM3KLG4_CUCME|nr:protoporphyrinogen oxidase 2 isoform X4 [Cucumis melo]
MKSSQSSRKKVAVVGAGVSGLAAAYKLKSHGFDVTVLEADERAGGKLRSVSYKGLIWDEGANTMTESEPEVQCLLDDLGLRDKQQFPISQNKRYIVRNGVPVLFQIILEPFLWKKYDSSKVSDDGTDESVGGFFQRHFGKEVVDYLIDPIVAGTSAGDPDSLSMSHSFPELWNIEKRFGSILAGLVLSKFSTKKESGGVRNGTTEKRKPRRGSFSFQNGMQTLTDTLSKELGEDALKLRSEVLSLSYNAGKYASQNWSLIYSKDKNSKDLIADAVIMTAPVCSVREMKFMKGGIPFPLNFLPEVAYMPLSVMITTFRKESVKRPLEGFGVLVPSLEQQNGLRTLGTLFSSMMFPNRASNDEYLYTTFIGGSRNRELAKSSTDELKQIVTTDLRQLLGVEGEPTFVNHFYWSKAFPLYGRNYDSVVKAIETMEKNLPGFFYAGNHRDGLSVGKSIASGCKAADLVISYLESSTDQSCAE